MTIGLDDVIAAETALSHVDGEAGRLIIAGHDLEALAGRVAFEDAVALLWEGLVPDLVHPRAVLGQARERAYGYLEPLGPQLAGLTPVEGMRMLLAGLPDAEVDHPTLAVGAAGVAAAMAVRGTQGLAPVAPDARSSHAADILRMMRDAPVSDDEAQGLDTYLVTVIDHGLNASTFTARVVASTQAGILSSVVAGLCALKGPLHGGAPGPVLDMLDAIGSIDNAAAWLDDAIVRGERLMGFGHRIYRVRDPRADVLKAAVGRLKGRGNRIAFAEAVEATALKVLERRKPGRRLDTNVEFYTAILLDALGVPREGFTPLFAAGRTAGWVAHAIEQSRLRRIIRPQSRYVGAWPAQAA
ncbi:citrate synthase/methylcitrate synthase [Microvirga terrestris]|uniref:citrate synthase (unknown stereospecificity) n=1 Tax=Microvirga terrestris TaxID=2791024 RepID=A0ABS0HPK4_9HYPH|nr:citrate synthase/methylcitrate synthase [Microvirga terrestris]MBF9195412.1 citrate synthase/methylcitrate synthase [Microvirga terrestris]